MTKPKTSVVSCRIEDSKKKKLITIANSLNLKVNDVLKIILEEGIKTLGKSKSDII